MGCESTTQRHLLGTRQELLAQEEEAVSWWPPAEPHLTEQLWLSSQMVRPEIPPLFYLLLLISPVGSPASITSCYPTLELGTGVAMQSSATVLSKPLAIHAFSHWEQSLGTKQAKSQHARGLPLESPHSSYSRCIHFCIYNHGYRLLLGGLCC